MKVSLQIEIGIVLMDGQWIGAVESHPNINIVLDIDDCADYYRASAFVYSSEQANTPSFQMSFRTPNKLPMQSVLSTIRVCWNAQALTPSEAAEKFPDTNFPNSLHLDLAFNDLSLVVTWQTQGGDAERAVLSKSRAGLQSELQADATVKTWHEFRNYVSTLEPRKFVFRGQSQPWKLRTSFHRTSRKDISRFMNEDIPALHRVLTARLRHFFQLEDNVQNAAFWNLAQHHGYPTSLIDWTFSPFVAAYFAFRPKLPDHLKFDYIRIFMFDEKSWREEVPQLNAATMTPPHFSNLLALAIENERALPQQAISFVSNVDDLEAHINLCSQLREKNYLSAFDLPISERDAAMRELSQMGMTPGTLFPGLDGACEEMRLQNFGF